MGKQSIHINKENIHMVSDDRYQIDDNIEIPEYDK